MDAGRVISTDLIGSASSVLPSALSELLHACFDVARHSQTNLVENLPEPSSRRELPGNRLSGVIALQESTLIRRSYYEADPELLPLFV
jgi:hypothetical protein